MRRQQKVILSFISSGAGTPAMDVENHLIPE